MRQPYDSDVSREQFGQILPDLEATKKKTRPRVVDLYEVFCAILYVIKNACTWRNLPHDFPNWKLVHYYYGIWTTKKNECGRSVLDYILARLVEIQRYEAGRNPLPSMLMLIRRVCKTLILQKKKVMMREKNFWHKDSYSRRHPRVAVFDYDNDCQRKRQVWSNRNVLST